MLYDFFLTEFDEPYNNTSTYVVILICTDANERVRMSFKVQCASE